MHGVLASAGALVGTKVHDVGIFGSKHHALGFIAIVVGAILVLLVIAAKLARRAVVTTAVMTLVPLLGIVVIVLGLLLYAHTI